ncbi:aldehyde dehydrogenase, partial [Candidatus Thorarchaeota archaeon]
MITKIIETQNRMQVSEAIPPSSQAEMDRALNVLTAHKDAWAMMDIPGRIALLDQIKQDMPGVEGRWIASGLEAKENQPDSFDEFVEWYSISVIYRYIRILRKALQDILQFGKPEIPGKVSVRPNGQVVAQVVPYDWKEAMALPGIRAEVWMDPSVSLQNGGIPQASFYHTQDKEGQVCVVLGAGNVGGLIPGDFMHKLFVEGQVVALKMNPVNEYLGPLLEEGFNAVIKAGFLQGLYEGAHEGAYLRDHPAVDSVHMTGSDRTFEAILFGPGEEGRQRKQARQPQFTKPFSAELGNISPVIVVPGPWSEKDIQNQSKRLGSWLVPNSSHNCLTPRLLIQMQDWEHRQKLNNGIADFLEGIKTDKAYYPGSFELHQQFLDEHPEALQLGKPQEGHLPWTFIQDVDPTNEDDIVFKCEPFMSLYSETALEASDVVEFIGKAVEFANGKVWGSLVASIVVHPKSMKDPAVAEAV